MLKKVFVSLKEPTVAFLTCSAITMFGGYAADWLVNTKHQEYIDNTVSTLPVKFKKSWEAYTSISNLLLNKNNNFKILSEKIDQDYPGILNVFYFEKNELKTKWNKNSKLNFNKNSYDLSQNEIIAMDPNTGLLNLKLVDSLNDRTLIVNIEPRILFNDSLPDSSMGYISYSKNNLFKDNESRSINWEYNDHNFSLIYTSTGNDRNTWLKPVVIIIGFLFAIIVTGWVAARNQIIKTQKNNQERFRDFTELSADWYWEIPLGASEPIFYNGLNINVNTDRDILSTLTNFIVSDKDNTIRNKRAFNEIELLHKTNNKNAYYLVSGKPFYDETGVYQGYRGVGKDITVLKDAQTYLEEKNVFMSTMFESIPNAFFYTDQNLNTLGFNKETLRLVENPYRPINAWWNNKDWLDLCNHCLYATSSFSRDIDLYVSNKLCHYRITLTPYIINNNRGFLGVLVDLTERKVLEEKLRSWADIIQNHNDGMIVIDNNLNIRSINNKAITLLNVKENIILRQNIVDLLNKVCNESDKKSILYLFTKKSSWHGEVILKVNSERSFPAWVNIQKLNGNTNDEFLIVITDITEKKESEAQIRLLAQFDQLTGLPNRTTFRDRAIQAISASKRNQTKCAILLIDLDRFKTVNDSLGSVLGDKIINITSERIVSNVRESDTVARLGGDEFVVLLNNITNAASVIRVTSSIVNDLNKEFEIDGKNLTVTASMGIAVYPDDGESDEVLLRHAETALTHAKNGGRNNYQFFTYNMNSSAMERLSMENDLRKAINNPGELELYYQPQFDVNTNKIVGAETLIRWNHPTKGFISPGSFIPMAEESGLIIPLGELIYRMVCERQKSFQGSAQKDFELSVNISALQFHHKDFLTMMMDNLEKTGADPTRIKLEVTEGVVMKTPETTVKLLNDLKEKGFKLSIDDFGTGYSSLSYLSYFPIDTLKIDQSFIKHYNKPANQAIIKAIIGIGQHLQLEIVAEGVETIEQLQYLTSNVCPIIQGYFIAKPMPYSLFEKWINNFDYLELIKNN